MNNAMSKRIETTVEELISHLNDNEVIDSGDLPDGIQAILGDIIYSTPIGSRALSILAHLTEEEVCEDEDCYDDLDEEIEDVCRIVPTFCVSCRKALPMDRNGNTCLDCSDKASMTVKAYKRAYRSDTDNTRNISKEQ
jgi:hypothetical protein